MQSSRLTVMLALGNVLLLTVVFHQARLLRRHGGLEPAGHPSARADPSGTSVPGGETSLTLDRYPVPQGTVVAASGSTQPTLVWSQVEAADYPTYIRNLRAIGVPEQTIRDIVSADVRQVFASKRAEVLANEFNDARFWECLPDRPEARADRMRRRREVDNAMGNVLRELLGPEVLPPLTDNDWKLAELNLQLAFLPPDKRDSTSGLLLRYADIDAHVKSLADGRRPTEDPGELGRIMDLYETKRAELTRLITPEDYEQIELTVSWTADNLRRAMVRFEPNEEEFRTIFRVWREHDEDLARLSSMHQPDPGNDHVFERIREFLGEERYAEYRSTWWQ